jgi:hypothetical protein
MMRCDQLVEKVVDGRVQIVDCSRKATVGKYCTQHYKMRERERLRQRLVTRAHTF